MGKQGPCYHCGVTNTPLWRNGPPEKPILCNACGSRWRTKGTLTNYTPLHARPDIVDFEGFRDSKAKAITIKTNEQKSEKRKQYDGNVDVEGEAPDSDQNFQKAFEHTSNRSSSGSAMSYSESCTHFGCTDMGSAQSNVRESLVPSRKRTCISPPKPSIQKLTKELCCILHEQQSSNLLGSSEDDLIFESETPLVSVEIGHGGVLIRHPNSVVREEESEASSLAIDNRVCIVNDAYSGLLSHSEHVESKGMSLQNIGDEQDKKPTGQEAAQDHMKRSKFSHGELYILQNSKSPLGSIDLRSPSEASDAISWILDVVSFEEFVRHLTCEEQKQLMKYLPYSDNEKLECLQSMFNSPQFVDTLLSFQQLLLKGIFYPSFHGENTEEYRVLKRLALVNLTKSKWVEYYQLLKDAMQNKGKDGKEVSTETSFPGCGNLAPTRRPHDVHSQNFPERKGTIKSHNRVLKCGNMNLPSTKSSQLNSSKTDIRESYDDMNDDASSCISLRSLFAFSPDRNSIMLDSLQFTEESSDQDFLFDVPLSASFP